MTFAETIRFRTSHGMHRYIAQLHADLNQRQGHAKVNFSSIVRDYVQDGIESGRLKAFSEEKYASATEKAAAA